MIKKIMIICMLSLLLCSVSVSALFTYPPQPKTKPEKEFPSYLLVLRYWRYIGSTIRLCADSKESAANSNYGWSWTYLYETYGSLDEVANRLNTYTGAGLNDPNELVGLWELKDNIADKILRMKTIKHIEPKHIEKIEWTEYNWEIVDSNKYGLSIPQNGFTRNKGLWELKR